VKNKTHDNPPLYEFKKNNNFFSNSKKKSKNKKTKPMLPPPSRVKTKITKNLQLIKK
jgi:hypothetical protein